MCWRDRIMCVSKKPVDRRGGWAGAFNWFSLFPFRPRCCFMFTSFNFYFLLSSCFGDALFCLPDSSCSLFIMLCCVMISSLFLPFMLYLLTHHPHNGSLPPVRNHWALKQTYISTPFFPRLAMKPHNNLVVWCTFMYERSSHCMMKWIIDRNEELRGNEIKSTLKWLFKFWNGENSLWNPTKWFYWSWSWSNILRWFHRTSIESVESLDWWRDIIKISERYQVKRHFWSP